MMPTFMSVAGISILDQVKENNGYVKIPETPGIGVNPDLDFIKKYEITF